MLQEHLGYLSDRVRIERFREAVAKVLRPGDRVVDLGSGSGILGLLCLRAGAAHVYCIDESPMLEVARETFRREGLADRATFVSGRTFRAELPERVQVAVCDHLGWFGFDYGVAALLADARRRLLVPGGRTIPSRVTLEVALVGSERIGKLARGWTADDVPDAYRWVDDWAVNSKHPIDIDPEELASAPTALGEIDFAGDVPDFVRWRADLPATREGDVHGVAGWFASELAPGVRMTNSPVAADAIRRSQALLPIDAATPVLAGDRAMITVMARPDDHVLAWELAFADGRRFLQSTWRSLPVSSVDLLRSAPERMPRPSREGTARGIVLSYCDGKRNAREIEEAILGDHPQLLPSCGEIRRFVAHVLARDTLP
jgi:protein arginine N-methyltransferase 1